MGEFVLYNQGVELSGNILRAFIDAFPDDMKKWGKEILTKNRLENPEPSAWYPLQYYLNALKDTSDTFGSNMLRNIGSRIPFAAITSEKVDALPWETLLETMDIGYKRNLRGADVGEIVYENLGKETGLNRARLTYSIVSPCAYDQGILEGVAKKWKPPEIMDIVVRHDDSKPCRKKGAKSCDYIVSWG